MPAKSEAQQRLMGMALAAKRGKGHFSEKIQEIAKSMSEKQLRDFAKTKHEGLPEKKADMTTQEQAYINGFIKRAAEVGMTKENAEELLKSAGGFWSSIPSALKSGFNAFKNTMQTARNATPAVANTAKFNPRAHLSPGELNLYHNRPTAPSPISSRPVNLAEHLSPSELAQHPRFKPPVNLADHLTEGEMALRQSITPKFNPVQHLSPGELQTYQRYNTPVSMSASNHVLPAEMMNRGGLTNPLYSSLAKLSPQAKRLMEMRNRLGQR